MGSRNKKLRKGREREKEEEEEKRHDLDRLSSLPDSILAHILSFLDTRSAVRTSILSKRFKLIWTLSQCLDFNLSEYQTECFYSRRTDSSYPVTKLKKSSVVAFVSFVNRVLQLREHINLAMFRLSLRVDVDSSAFVANCIHYAAQHNVKNLRIRAFDKRKPLALPELLLTSSSLITLHLHNAISNSIELPKSVSLPNLSVLRLKNFEFSDSNFNGEVFRGCPSLETLVLSKCCMNQVDQLKVLDVSCLSLKNLEIRYWRSPWKCFDDHVISVNAPRLAFFKLQGHLVKMEFRDGLPCLGKACIDLCYPTACSMVNVSDRKRGNTESFLSVFRDMCNVRVLSLSLKTIEIACAIPDLQTCQPTIFENLRLLKFTAENKYREKIVQMEKVRHSLESAATDELVINRIKENKSSPECSKAKTRHISIPIRFMQFLLKCSPSAEILSIEIPKVSSD